MKTKSIIFGLIFIFGLSTITFTYNNAYSYPLQLSEIYEKTIFGKDFINKNQIKSYNRIDDITTNSEDIFWDLNNGTTITYNPVVLFVNYFYWDSLPFYEYYEEYIFEMFANDSVIFDRNYAYARYNQYYYERGYDWNISIYDPGTLINLTVYFYQENDENFNHTTSILVIIGEIKETPEIDFDDFVIDLFHFPGSFYSSEAYIFYEPEGLNPYYHFSIFEDGYIELIFSESNTFYKSKELSSNEAKTLLQELIDLGFYQLKSAYFAPSYSSLDHSWYDIRIESLSSHEDRIAEESFAYFIRPYQFSLCLDAIWNCVNDLEFKPARELWSIVLITLGSSFGGISCLVSAFYVFFGIRRRAR